MFVQVSVVDSLKRGLLRELDSKKPEVTLETRVHKEGTSSWVHGTNIEGVLDILKGKLVTVIPMLIILVLSDKSNSSLSVVSIKGRHVKIINEIDELILADRSVSLTCLLLKLLLENSLEQG